VANARSSQREAVKPDVVGEFSADGARSAALYTDLRPAALARSLLGFAQRSIQQSAATSSTVETTTSQE